MHTVTIFAETTTRHYWIPMGLLFIPLRIAYSKFKYRRGGGEMRKIEKEMARRAAVNAHVRGSATISHADVEGARLSMFPHHK